MILLVEEKFILGFKGIEKNNPDLGYFKENIGSDDSDFREIFD